MALLSRAVHTAVGSLEQQQGQRCFIGSARHRIELNGASIDSGAVSQLADRLEVHSESRQRGTCRHTFCRAGAGKNRTPARPRLVDLQDSADGVCSAPRANRFSPSSKPYQHARCLLLCSGYTILDLPRRLSPVPPTDRRAFEDQRGRGRRCARSDKKRFLYCHLFFESCLILDGNS